MNGQSWTARRGRSQLRELFETGAAAAQTAPPLPAWRVLDMSQAISGPYAGRILSDLGADVVRVEGPRTDVTDLFGVVTDGRGRHVRADERRASAASASTWPCRAAPTSSGTSWRRPTC